MDALRFWMMRHVSEVLFGIAVLLVVVLVAGVVEVLRWRRR
jgi:hypothetical protein